MPRIMYTLAFSAIVLIVGCQRPPLDPDNTPTAIPPISSLIGRWRLDTDAYVKALAQEYAAAKAANDDAKAARVLHPFGFLFAHSSELDLATDGTSRFRFGPVLTEGCWKRIGGTYRVNMSADDPMVVMQLTPSGLDIPDPKSGRSYLFRRVMSVPDVPTSELIGSWRIDLARSAKASSEFVAALNESFRTAQGLPRGPAPSESKIYANLEKSLRNAPALTFPQGSQALAGSCDLTIDGTSAFVPYEVCGDWVILKTQVLMDPNRAHGLVFIMRDGCLVFDSGSDVIVLSKQ